MIFTTVEPLTLTPTHMCDTMLVFATCASDHIPPNLRVRSRAFLLSYDIGLPLEEQSRSHGRTRTNRMTPM